MLFRNALFRTDIKAARREMDILSPDTGESRHLTIGQVELTNEQCVIEDLNLLVRED